MSLYPLEGQTGSFGYRKSGDRGQWVSISVRSSHPHNVREHRDGAPVLAVLHIHQCEENADNITVFQNIGRTFRYWLHPTALQATYLRPHGVCSVHLRPFVCSRHPVVKASRRIGPDTSPRLARPAHQYAEPISPMICTSILPLSPRHAARIEARHVIHGRIQFLYQSINNRPSNTTSLNVPLAVSKFPCHGRSQLHTNTRT